MNGPVNPERVAAIDCGTNSIRLLIVEPDEGRGLREIERRTEIVRLGQGVDATGELHPDALRRTFAAVEGYAQLIKGAGVDPDRIAFVATSATRDARNREAFDNGIKARLGVRPQVISGRTEAGLSYRGALSGADTATDSATDSGTATDSGSDTDNEADAALAEPVLVMDIGGGSTELIVGRDGEIEAAVSLDMGAVRVTERFWHSDPPGAQDLEAARFFVGTLLDGAEADGIDLGAVRRWIGVAGTATTLAGVALELPAYDRARVHGATLTRGQLDTLLARLSGLSADRIREIPSMHPKRADVITAGTLIAATVAQRVGVDRLTVSEADILDGIALAQLDR